MFGHPIDVSNGKYSLGSSSESDFNPIVGLNLKHVFIKPIQVIPLQTFIPQNDQACSAETTFKQNDLSVQFKVKHVTQEQPEHVPLRKPKPTTQPET